MREYLLHSFLIIVVICLTGINSQLGPPPPRFSVPVPVRQPLQYRNERLVNASPTPGVLRIRRPIQAAGRANTLQSLQAAKIFNDAPKPVTEENESAETPAYIPQQIISQSQQPSKQQLPSILYSTDENGEILDQNHQIDFSTTARFLQPTVQEHIVPTTLRSIGNAQRFAINQDRSFQSEPQPSKPPIRARPDYREPRPQFEIKELQPNRRPLNEYTHEREKKPVAQILRKYREENEDGTITWGFENDDGSYKEEIIGNNCVTRGRYGYVDPDGVKREYNYETGIQCDPNKRDSSEQTAEDDQYQGPGAALHDNGAYVDYQDNQMVLPNGQRLNLDNVGKSKIKRPNYRNN